MVKIESLSQNIARPDMLVNRALKNLVRERNVLRNACMSSSCEFLIEHLGSLVADYCYGLEIEIPERIVDILQMHKFTILNKKIRYCLGFSYNYEYVPNIWMGMYKGEPIGNAWFEFILTGYASGIYDMLCVYHGNYFVEKYSGNWIQPSEFDLLRYKMLESAADPEYSLILSKNWSNFFFEN